MGHLFAGLLSLAIFGSFWWAAVLLGILVVLLFVSEVTENGFLAFAAVLAFVACNHVAGNLPLLGLVTWTNVGIYFGVGLIFTLIRTYFYGRSQAIKGYAKVDFDYLKGNVSRWWSIWPVSLLKWLCSDLLKDFWNWIYDKFGKWFEYVLQLGFNNAKEKLDKKAASKEKTA